MSSSATPSYVQSVASSFALLSLSIWLAPFTFGLTVAAWVFAGLYARVTGFLGGSEDVEQPDKSPVVLINGAKMYKSLGLVRALGRAGCTVILAEQGSGGDFSATRFSRYVSKYVQLPQVIQGQPETSRAYCEALANLAVRENIDIFLPCSGAGSTIEDAQAAGLMKQSLPDIRSFIPSPKVTRELHEKDRFMKLLGKLDCVRPETHMVKSPEQAIEVMSNSKYPMIMKATAVLDDVGRNDMTRYPLEGDRDPWPKTLARLREDLAVPLNEDSPYIMQQFIQGTEWCTHATVVNSQLKAFACCPSSDMLMHYQDETESRVGKLAKEWTLHFLSAWAENRRGQKEPLTGHFSMDFIYSQEEDKLYPIECNPRVHTAICLLSGNEYFSSAYLAPHSVEVAEPLAGTALKAWVGHELTAVVLPSFLPFLCLLHPLFGKRQPDPTTSQESALQLFMSDPTFALDDPLPFWVLYHLQWPVLLLKQILSGNKWSRINVSTARIFEC